MKRTLFVLIVTLLAGVLLAGTYSGGSGIPGDEYEIANLDDLEELSLTSGDWGADFIQTTNINASATSGWDGGAGFSPIGNGSTKFTGSYNGDGFIISDITMNRPSSNYQSVFGYTNGAVIQNLGLVDCSITAAGATGALSGYSSNGSVADCYSTGSITGNYMNIGGLIGGLLSGTTINDCYSTCTIIAPDEGRVGGLIGYCNGPVEDCYSTGSVTGLAGVGGLVGLHYGIITKCYSTSNVSGNSSGGLVGINNGGTVNNCYSRGNVSGTTDVGGFTGVNSGTVDKCYSTGTVSGTTKGGLIGTNNSTTTNSFWDTQASGESTSDGGTGKTTAEMKNVRTFTDVAWSAGLDSLWDFVDDPYDDTGTDDIWDIDGVTNGGYPFFTEEDPPTPVELSTFTAVYTNGSSLLEWTTQTESNNMGWNIYRSETGLEDGVQVNGHLIHGAGTSTEPTYYEFSDQYPVETGVTYNYWLESRDYSGNSENFGPISLNIPEQNQEDPDVPDTAISKARNYPNPFAPDTEISFNLGQPAMVSLTVYNIKGQEIISLFNGYSPEGEFRKTWNGRDTNGKEVSSGIYTYIIKAGSEEHTGKMILTR